jgi:hypothetical protein
MTESQDSKGVSPEFSDPQVQAWMAEHRTDLEKSVTGNSILYTSLVIGFVVGLAAHVAGYVLLSSAPREPLGLLADLLHALGWSLWTGVVVAVFLQIIPEAKRRQIRTALDAYEAFQRDRRRTGSDTDIALEKPGKPK